MIEHINSNIEETSDFNEWLQAMKMVAYLPDGIPVGFRRKLWLALSDQYLSMKNIDWETERVKYFSNATQEDDENLGDQIVKDLHRTGTNLCSGPTGSINEGKLKRILQGYARWNPEVGYCQGFNMLGALILQVMDKEEMESMKVMLYIIEGIFPSGYFSGSLNGLQVDMAVFRELMFVRLPKLAKHLQRLQGPADERCCEPPLTNVFTIQWFITIFSTSLPFNCVIRIWDLVLIEGSGILLRTALAIWSILEEKILCSKSADDFYCKMGKLSTDMLNGTIIDSNGLIEKIVEFGPIPQLEQLRKNHLDDIKSWTTDTKIKFPSLDEDGDSDDEADLSTSKTMAMRLVRKRNSRTAINRKSIVENHDRIAIDIPLLKKQYHRMREHQRQAHTILFAAVARQSISSNTLPTNILLDGRNANNIRRNSSLSSAVPPVKRSQYNCKLLTSSSKQNDNTSFSISKKISPKLKKRLIYQNKEQLEEKVGMSVKSSSILNNIGAKSLKRNESSSCSDSDNNSSTSTSLCDDDDSDQAINFESSMELSPVHRNKQFNFQISEYDNLKIYNERIINQLTQKSDECEVVFKNESLYCDKIPKVINDSDNNLLESNYKTSFSVENKVVCANIANLGIDKTINTFNNESISTLETSTIDLDSQNTKTPISTPINISFLNKNLTSISGNPIIPLNQDVDSKDLISLHIEDLKLIPKTNYEFSVNESGVTNKYFERVNDIKSPTNINLDLISFQTYDTAQLSTNTSVSEEIRNIMEPEAKQNNNSNTIATTLSSDIIDNIKEPGAGGEDIFNDSQKTETFSESSEQSQSELANKIIEENSRVLRRILNKDITTDKHYTLHSCDQVYKTNEGAKYIFHDSDLSFPVNILKENSENDNDMSYPVNILKENSVNKFSKTADLNELEDQKTLLDCNVISENKLLSNNLGNLNIILLNKDILTATESCSESVLVEPKSPNNGALNFVTTGFDDCKIVNDISINSCENSNREEKTSMTIKEVLSKDNLQETINNCIINTTNFSSSNISLTKPTAKFITDSLQIVYENDIISENNDFHHPVEPYFKVDKQNKEYSIQKISDNQEIDYIYSQSQDISLNNSSSYDYIMNTPSLNFENHEVELMSKKVDKDSIMTSCNEGLEEHNIDISQDKSIDISEKVNYSRIIRNSYEVCDNKISYGEFDITSQETQLNKDSSTINLSEKYIKPKDEISTNYISDVSEPDLFTRNKNIEWLFEKDYNYDKTYSNINLSKVYDKNTIDTHDSIPDIDAPNTLDIHHSIPDIDAPFKVIDSTKQEFTKDIKLNVYPVISSKTDSKIPSNIVNDNILSPVLNNKNFNKYSNYSKDENINDRLISIKNTIKSIDSLCDDTIYSRLSKKSDDYYDVNNFLQPLYIKRELKHMPIYNFEEGNIMKDYTNLNNSSTIGRKEQLKYFTTSERGATSKYTNIINTTTSPILNIRHTTVTSALYDRILAQCEEEKQKKMDHLHLNMSSNDINSTSLNVLSGNSHSAENSPLKIKSDKLNSKTDSKSCSNILLQVQNRT